VCTSRRFYKISIYNLITDNVRVGKHNMTRATVAPGTHHITALTGKTCLCITATRWLRLQGQIHPMGQCVARMRILTQVEAELAFTALLYIIWAHQHQQLHPYCVLCTRWSQSVALPGPVCSYCHCVNTSRADIQHSYCNDTYSNRHKLQSLWQHLFK